MEMQRLTNGHLHEINNIARNFYNKEQNQINFEEYTEKHINELMSELTRFIKKDQNARLQAMMHR